MSSALAVSYLESSSRWSLFLPPSLGSDMRSLRTSPYESTNTPYQQTPSLLPLPLFLLEDFVPSDITDTHLLIYCLTPGPPLPPPTQPLDFKLHKTKNFVLFTAVSLVLRKLLYTYLSN